MILVELALIVLFGWAFVTLIRMSPEQGGPGNTPSQFILMFASLLAVILVMPGFFIVQPNMAKALTLFGRYKGTVRTDGFFWTNPFMSKSNVSLRAQTLNGERMKVNDSVGNPVEIATMFVEFVDRVPPTDDEIVLLRRAVETVTAQEVAG